MLLIELEMWSAHTSLLQYCSVIQRRIGEDSNIMSEILLPHPQENFTQAEKVESVKVSG